MELIGILDNILNIPELDDFISLTYRKEFELAGIPDNLLNGPAKGVDNLLNIPVEGGNMLV